MERRTDATGSLSGDRSFNTKKRRYRSGVFIGMIRVQNYRIISTIIDGWINFIRGVPVMVQIFIIYYGIATQLPQFWAAVLSLTINSSVYIAEHTRAGLQAVNKGQMEAARCIGMSNLQGYWYIIIPQAIKNILPSLVNEFILLIKNTSIVSVIALHELTYTSNSVRANTFLAFEPLIVTAFIYFIMTYILKKLVGVLERKLHEHD